MYLQVFFALSLVYFSSGRIDTQICQNTLTIGDTVNGSITFVDIPSGVEKSRLFVEYDGYELSPPACSNLYISLNNEIIEYKYNDNTTTWDATGVTISM